jgi:hypothetical protein
MTTILSSSGTHTATAQVDGAALWLSPTDFEHVSGYTLKPEGFCRGPVCIPIPSRRQHEFRRGEAINLGAFATFTEQPLVGSRNGDTWVLEEPAEARNEALLSLIAPDFELPDLAGNQHKLSDYRGNKILISSWASW